MPQAATADIISLFPPQHAVEGSPPQARVKGQPPPAGAPVAKLEAPFHIEAFVAGPGMVLVDACIPLSALESLMLILRMGIVLEVEDGIAKMHIPKPA